MPRIVVRTPLPKGATPESVMAAARSEAVAQVNLHVVEQHTEPATSNITTPDTEGRLVIVPSSNDASVDRILVTQWDFTR